MKIEEKTQDLFIREISDLQQQPANEKAIMVEISRIIGSTLKIEEVYERFAQEAKKLIPFDRIAVNIIHAQDRTFTHAYVSGFDVPERRVRKVVPLAGSGTEEVMRTGSILTLQGPKLENGIRQFPGLLPGYRAGLRSMVLVPLISQDQVIGVLNWGSTKPDVYTKTDIKLAENIGAQIAAAIANAELFAALRRGEEALRASEEKYRTLVENATEAIFIIQDEKIKFSNCQTISLSGYSAEELAKISFTGLIHPDDREAVLDRYRRRIQGEDIPAIQTYRILTKVGEELWVQCNSVPITWEGCPATLNFARDMTREKKLEAQFQTAQKMEAIGSLAGGIAHDFNNLLMGIQGHVSLLLFDLDPSHPYYESLKKIEGQVKNGANLSSQLLAFARRGKYEVQPSDVNKIIQQTSSMFERTRREIHIHRKFQDGDLDNRTGSGADRTGSYEPLRERLAGHARRGKPLSGKPECHPGPGSYQVPFRGAGELCADCGPGYRNRDGPEDPAADLRPLLYHQGNGPGNRVGAGFGVWDHQESWRIH